jgi:hypothetical protein
MKTAIILLGHVRTWEKTKESFISTFSNLNADIFVSTYDRQYGYHPYIRGVTNYHGDEVLSEPTIESLFSGLSSNVYVDVTEAEMMDKYISQQQSIINPSMRGIQSSMAQFIKLKHAIDNLIEVENEKNIKYDYIIKTRCDILYENDLNFSIDNNQVLVDSCNVFPNDCFIMADRNSFIEISNFMVNEFYHFTNPTSNEKPPHTLLLNAFNNSSLNIVSKKIMKSVMRINGEQFY